MTTQKQMTEVIRTEAAGVWRDNMCSSQYKKRIQSIALSGSVLRFTAIALLVQPK